jgi:hypothetical protein
LRGELIKVPGGHNFYVAVPDDPTAIVATAAKTPC